MAKLVKQYQKTEVIMPVEDAIIIDLPFVEVDSSLVRTEIVQIQIGWLGKVESPITNSGDIWLYDADAGALSTSNFIALSVINSGGDFPAPQRDVFSGNNILKGSSISCYAIALAANTRIQLRVLYNRMKMTESEAIAFYHN